MIAYRSFRNDDPPRLAEIWRRHAPNRALMQPMSAYILEQCVFAKPFFDRQGLILAVDEGRPIGFVHAGFAAKADGSDLDREVGIICLLLVTPHPEREAVKSELLARAEQYLQQRGARVLQSGSCLATGPFYLGLCGGSTLAGAIRAEDSDDALFRQADYQSWRELAVLQRSLSGFRLPIDRRQMQLRRRFNVDMGYAPAAERWLSACDWAFAELLQFGVVPRNGGRACAVAKFWDMEPLASSWGVSAMGIVDVQVDEALRRQGLATFLLGEALRQLQSQSVKLIEVRIDRDAAAARGLFEKLGFACREYPVVLRKKL